MFFLQIILMAFRALRANLLRSVLATLGVIIGVGAVISAMSILEGSQRNIRDRLESLGSETIMITPATVRAGGRPIGVAQTLSIEDADYLSDIRNCPHIAAAAPEVSGAGLSIKFFRWNEDGDVLGTSQAYADMFGLKMSQGRFLTRNDVNTEQKVVVLGDKISRDLFRGGPALNRQVKIKGVSFRVIGVLEKKGSVGVRNVDTLAIVPVTTAMSRLLGSKALHMISVQASGSENVDQAMTEIKRSLRRRHDIRFRQGQKDDFEIFSQEEGRKQVREVTMIFQVVLYSIAGISLLVGGIGIMNIMLVSVTERTREIGVRMAVGAHFWNILQQFLIEARVISLLGGAFGVAMGYGLSKLMGRVQDLLETYTTMEAVVIALIMAVMTGLASGIYPAYKAAKLDPVDALRYE